MSTLPEPVGERPHMPGYGVEEATWSALPWSWATERLTANRNYWVVTVSPQSVPHAMPVWGVWHDESHPVHVFVRSRVAQGTQPRAQPKRRGHDRKHGGVPLHGRDCKSRHRHDLVLAVDRTLRREVRVEHARPDSATTGRIPRTQRGRRGCATQSAVRRGGSYDVLDPPNSLAFIASAASSRRWSASDRPSYHGVPRGETKNGLLCK